MTDILYCFAAIVLTVLLVKFYTKYRNMSLPTLLCYMSYRFHKRVAVKSLKKAVKAYKKYLSIRRD